MSERHEQLIESLKLSPLPGEGGFFRRVFTHPDQIAEGNSVRRPMTAIYFLITRESFSALHRIPHFENYVFLEGDPATMLQIDAESEPRLIQFGPPGNQGKETQVTIKPQVWQGTRLDDGGSYALFYVTVSLGYEEGDLELTGGEELIKRHPDWSGTIQKYIR